MLLQYLLPYVRYHIPFLVHVYSLNSSAQSEAKLRSRLFAYVGKWWPVLCILYAIGQPIHIT